MNAKIDKREVDVAAPESAIEVRLKHIENDVAEIKTDLRSNAAEIKVVRENVGQLQVQLEVRTRELGERLEARTRELGEKFENRFLGLDAKFDNRLLQLDEKFESRFRDLNDKVAALLVSVERTRTWMLYIVGGLALTVIGLVLRTTWPH